MQTHNFYATAPARLAGIALLCVAGLARCSAPDVRVVETRNNQTAHVGIGFIENRDLRFSPFTGKDFENMLEFEFLKNGYTIEDLDFAALRESKSEPQSPAESDTRPGEASQKNSETGNEKRNETGIEDDRDAGDDTERQPQPGPGETESEDAPANDAETEEHSYYSYGTPIRGQTTPVSAPLRTGAGEALAQSVADEPQPKNAVPYRIYDDTYPLLPERLRSIAGEHGAPGPDSEKSRRFDQRHLTMEEIRVISKSNTFDYYIQGAISRTETGLLLEVEESTLVFLEIFDAEGRRVGAINMSIDDATLRQASFLQAISERIALAFDRTIHAARAEAGGE